ncbi:MAG: DinB family protein [Ktedonobacterales bacterium]
MATREHIQQQLIEARGRLLAFYQALSPEELRSICTQSEIEGAAPWTASDHLAHVNSTERALMNIVTRSMEGVDDPVGFGVFQGDHAKIMDAINSRNEISVTRHRGDPLDLLLTTLAATRADTLALLDRVSDEQLAVFLASSEWGDKTVGALFLTVAGHDDMHRAWVQKGLEASA